MTLRGGAFVVALLFVSASARAQDAASQRTIALDLWDANQSLNDLDHWEWLTESDASAAVRARGNTRVDITTRGALATVTVRRVREGLSRATCWVTLRREEKDPYARWSSAWASANNLCDHVAREAMPRSTWHPGYGGWLALLDVFAGPGYPIAGPILHLANKRPITALTSFGVRIGAISAGMGLGAVIGLAATPPNSHTIVNVFGGWLVGGIVGVFAATIFDATYLARARFGPDGFAF